MYAPSKVGEQPSVEVSKEFMLKPNKIHLEASLDKEVRFLNLIFFFFFVSNKTFFKILALSSWRNDICKCTHCQ